MVFQQLQLEIFEKSWHFSLFPPDIAIGFDSDALSIFRGLLSRAPSWAYYGTPVVTLNLSDLAEGRIELLESIVNRGLDLLSIISAAQIPKLVVFRVDSLGKVGSWASAERFYLLRTSGGRN